MTFRKMIKKNFMYHFKNYLSFFLCISFSIMIFFMYTTLVYNPVLHEEIRHTTISSVMRLVLIIIIIFSFLFISYSYSTFIKSKYHEIGLFITLGMTSKDVNKMNRYEYFIIMSLSIAVAIVTGVIFSKLFFMVFLSIINFKGIPFILNYKSFLLTIIVFIGIFTIVLLINQFKINKFHVTELLKQDKVSEENTYNSPFLGLLGIILIICSYLLIYFTLVKNFVRNPFIYILVFILMTLLGLYLLISQCGQIFLNFVRKKKYNKNILFYSEIRHNFKEYKNILFITTLLIGVAIYFIGLTFSVYATQLDEVKKTNPYDLMLIETSYSNPLTDDEIHHIFNEHGVNIKEEKSIEFIQMDLYKTVSNEFTIWGGTVTISDEMFKEISDENLDVKKGYAVPVSFEDGALNWYEKKEDIVYKDHLSNKEFRFKYQEEIVGYYFNDCNYQPPFMIIIDTEDYNKVVNYLGEQRLERFKMYKFDNWMQSKSLVLNFVDAVKEKNPNKIEGHTYTQLYNDWHLMPSSRVLVYENNMRNAAFNFFVMCFIGIIFSISIGVVLYLKLFNDIPKERKKYEKIKKIGLTDKEMRKPVFNRLKVIFFIPLILGLITGSLYIIITAMNFIFYEKVLLYCGFVMIVFIFIHTVFYLVTRKKYLEKIIL